MSKFSSIFTKNYDKMKKLAIFLILVAMSGFGFGQSNVSSTQIATSLNITADTSINVQSASAFRNNYTWQIWANWTSSTLAGVPYIKIQVSHNGTNWLDYPNLDSISVTLATQNKAFEDFILPANYMRLYINMTTGDTLKAFNCWKTFKRP